MYKIGLLILLLGLPLQSFAYCTEPLSDTNASNTALATSADNSSPLCVSSPDTNSLKPYYSSKLPEFNFAEPSKTSSDDYWSDWGLKYRTEPFVSDQYSFGHLGFGVWSPDKDTNDSWGNSFKTTTYTGQSTTDITTDPEAWVMNHGVQLSLGFGNKSEGQPRIRFDYLWHENYDDNVRMQVQFPF